jgi:hypothetical protein
VKLDAIVGFYQFYLDLFSHTIFCGFMSALAQEKCYFLTSEIHPSGISLSWEPKPFNLNFTHPFKMPTLNRKQLITIPVLTVFGAAYFVAFSGWELHPAVRNQLMLLPIQIGVLIYLLWWRRREP